MIIVFPMLVSRAVSENSIPGICKLLENYIIVHKQDLIMTSINTSNLSPFGRMSMGKRSFLVKEDIHGPPREPGTKGKGGANVEDKERELRAKEEELERARRELEQAIHDNEMEEERLRQVEDRLDKLQDDIRDTQSRMDDERIRLSDMRRDLDERKRRLDIDEKKEKTNEERLQFERDKQEYQKLRDKVDDTRKDIETLEKRKKELDDKKFKEDQERNKLINIGKDRAQKVKDRQARVDQQEKDRQARKDEFEAARKERQEEREKERKEKRKEKEKERRDKRREKEQERRDKQREKAASAKIMTSHDAKALSLEPTFITIEKTDRYGARTSEMLGIKVVPMRVKSDVKLSHLILHDTHLKTFTAFLLKMGRSVTRFFYKQFDKWTRRFRVLGGLTPSGDPRRDIIMGRTGMGKNSETFIVLSKQEDIDDYFIDNVHRINRLYNMGWGNFMIADDIGRSVYFCMKNFKGMCNIIPYSMMYQLLGQTSAYESMEDATKANSSIFKIGRRFNKLIGECKADQKMYKYSQLNEGITDE